ncbi:MAG: prepilin peptidase [Leptospira sp.]|nr:prepilin peptidase [Leptospira sp.]
MFIFLYLLLFLFGSCIASFYITTAERVLFYFYGKGRKVGSFWERMIQLLTYPSHCPSCKTKVSPLYLTPVLGYFLTKGKCPTCGVRLSWVYPTSEFLFGILGVISFVLTQDLLFTISFLFLIGHLIVSIHTDAKYFSLDYENLPFILFFGSFCNYALTKELPGMIDLYVFLGFAVFYVSIYFLFKNGMGLGDVFFAPCFAFLAGHPFWLFFLNSSYLLAIIITIVSRKKGESLRGKMIPMGVFFSLGLFFTMIAKVMYFNLGIEGFTGEHYEP